MEKKDVALFPHREKDFNLKIRGKSVDSKFDAALKKRWNQIECDNVLRYSVKSHQSKILEGKYGFIVQLNTERATMRRKPEEMTSMQQPFNPERFNFMKISHKEILFDIGNGDGNDIITVNVSPILPYHCLILTQRFSGLPQQATLYSFQKAVEVLLLSNSENMKVLFNSLCANASVNHLHWHLYYLNNRMLLESISLQHLVGSIYTLQDFPAKGFCLKFSSFEDKDINKYVSYAHKIVSCLQKNEIAHNIHITRAKTDFNKQEFDDIRIYIWAREYGHTLGETDDFNVAAVEVFGHIPMKTEEAYIHVSEDSISKRLEDATLNAFLSARERIRKYLQEEEENNDSSNK